MDRLVLVLGVLGVLHGVNALRPARHLFLFGPAFFASWLTIELALQHLVIGAMILIAAVATGAVGSLPGLIGVALVVVTEALLVSLALTARRTPVIVSRALADLGAEPQRSSFPRHLVAFPFLLNLRTGVRRRRNLPFARVAGRTLRLDVTVPSAPVPGGGELRPALLQIHGGGWVIGDKREQGIPLLNHMAAQGWVGFNANYRLSPGAAFPDHMVDVKRALAWIREHAGEWGVDPDFVCVTGGSAGGHLSALTALTANEPVYQPGFESADTSVAAAVPFYGIYDLTPHSRFGSRYPAMFSRFLEPWVMKRFEIDEPERFREASPTHRVHPDAPPFFVLHGDVDLLAPVEDARTFAAALQATSRQPVAYAELRGAQHAFEIFPSYRAARSIEGVDSFLNTVWARHIPNSSPNRWTTATGSG